MQGLETRLNTNLELNIVPGPPLDGVQGLETRLNTNLEHNIVPGPPLDGVEGVQGLENGFQLYSILHRVVSKVKPVLPVT